VQRVGLIGTTFRVPWRLSRNLERMGRGLWVLLEQHFLCRGGCTVSWNGWVAAGGSYSKNMSCVTAAVPYLGTDGSRPVGFIGKTFRVGADRCGVSPLSCSNI